MKLIKLSDIHIPENRQRRNFDLKSLNELAASIRTNGLFHPLVLRSTIIALEPGKAGKKFWLVAGERRLRAISDIYELNGNFKHDTLLIPHGEVPYIELGDLDELAREEAELDENIKRVDLSWQERAEATARLTEIRTKRAAASGHPPRNIILEVARELTGKDLPSGGAGKPQETVRREVIVARHLADPEVRAAKDVNEAFKILKRKEESQRRVQLAETVGRTYTAETAHTILNEDSLAWMARAEAGSFDVILTDPPYGIGADEFGDSGGAAAGAHFYEDSYETWQHIIEALAVEGFRITKPEAHAYVFCDITRFDEAKKVFTAAGWWVHRTPIIWHKPNGNRVPWPEHGPQRKHELILYAVKGKKKVTRIYGDVVSYPADENLGHPAQKPVALFVDLLRRSCDAGHAILDPFAGSGPILAAASELKLKATAIEQDQAAYGICVQRLKKAAAQPDFLAELMNS